MAKVSLKRLVKQKETAALLADLERGLGGGLSVYSDEGGLLYGQEAEAGPEYPVVLEGEFLGVVRGGPAAPLASSLLGLLAVQEYAKRSVTTEALVKYKEITLLYNMAEKVAGRVRPEEIGQLVIEGALRLIGADRASVMLHRKYENDLEILAALGDDLPLGTKVRADFSIFSQVLDSGVALLLNDAHSDPRFKQGAIKVSSLICAPLMVSEQIIGLLFVTSEEQKHYTSEDLRLITALATQAAAAIETTRLIKNLEQKVAERTRELRQANEQLVEEIKERKQVQKRLQDELNEAADYVRSLLPAAIAAGPVRTDWRFTPSTSLGGDSFGYFWLDEDHFAVYLLDVSGHGVGAALLSVSILNTLRSFNLPDTDFTRPDQVLTALNNTFPMEQQDGRYFTMWYGVYDRKTRQLSFASGGHPPALLVSGWGSDRVLVAPLHTKKMFLGGMPGLEYKMETYPVNGPCRLYVFCDGVYEITRADGTVWPFEDFVEYLKFLASKGEPVLDSLFTNAREMNGSDQLDDDFSIMEIVLD
ncbi:MAG: SpoIIE family protein phosphatase [Thermodesulfobacteriota bacterium]